MHGVEVVAELLDRAALAGGALGAAVAALVVEHHAHAGVGEGGEEGPLEVPGAPVEREPVHEHHGEGGLAVGLDLLARQAHAVVGHHRAGLAQRGFAGLGELGGEPSPVGGDLRVLLGRDADDDTGGRRAERAREHAPAGLLHEAAPV